MTGQPELMSWTKLDRCEVFVPGVGFDPDKWVPGTVEAAYVDGPTGAERIMVKSDDGGNVWWLTATPAAVRRAGSGRRRYGLGLGLGLEVDDRLRPAASPAERHTVTFHDVCQNCGQPITTARATAAPSLGLGELAPAWWHRGTGLEACREAGTVPTTFERRNR